MRILVTGAGGFIGHHLVNRLKSEGNFVRGVDLKYPEFSPSRADQFIMGDLRIASIAQNVTKDIDEVYQLAADMGGIGYITKYLADISRNNILINVNMLDAAVQSNVSRYLYTSSACVYNQNLQRETDVTPLKEEDAYPALPERGYGWEKLFAEEMCQYYQQDYNLNIRIVRFHNVFGPDGTYQGGKEKSPAALCRKVATAVLAKNHNIEIWGDGNQTRSYMYIDDCIDGIRRLMESDYDKPLNLGTNELISINELASVIEHIAAPGKTFWHHYDTSKPQGVRGRNSDNTRLKKVLGWEPKTELIVGLKPTYEWIYNQVKKDLNGEETV